MPQLLILHTPQLDSAADIGGLCSRMAAAMRGCRDESGQAVFPTGGIRVLAYPAANAAVGDGTAGLGFIYLNLRIGRGRSALVQQQVGKALSASVREHLAPLLQRQRVGVTLQIDEGPEVFDAKLGNLHSYFAPRRGAGGDIPSIHSSVPFQSTSTGDTQ